MLVTHGSAVVSDMCDRLSVSRQGAEQEMASLERLRALAPGHPHIRARLMAPRSYDRATVDGLEDNFGYAGPHSAAVTG